MPVSEIYKAEICPNCHSYVKMQYTPGGLSYCPKCQYSPILGKVISGTTTSNQNGFVPPCPPKVH